VQKSATRLKNQIKKKKKDEEKNAKLDTGKQ
jgi:hypothetical protein